MINRFEFENGIAKTFGNTIGFIANVINTSCDNPESKLLGLYNLAKAGEVTTSGNFDIFSVSIKGEIKAISELENYKNDFSNL